MHLRKMTVMATTALVLLSVSAELSHAQTTSCTTAPPPNPSKTFLENFLNNCYATGLLASMSAGGNLSDLTETYAGFYFHVNPGYEVILVGDFPQSNYLNIGVDDGHMFTLQSFYDAQLKPLASSHVNPFLPGVTYQPNQLYAVALQFGGTQPANIQAGCGYGAGMNFYANVVDGTKRHPGVSWNGSPLVPANFPSHDDAGPNIGGMVTVRQYSNVTSSGGYGFLATPAVIVRDLSTGCAVPVANAVASDPDNVLPSQVITLSNPIAGNWLNPSQIWAHKAFRDMKPTYCYTLSPVLANYYRPDIYIENPDPDAAYLVSLISPQAVNWLVTKQGFLRLRFQLPTTAAIPCAGCSLTGLEQLRHFNISFANNNTNFTLATIGPPDLVTDPNGFVTLIVGFGSAPPSYVTASNYYTYLDFSTISGYANLNMLGVRTVLPAATFACSASAVNYKTSEGNSLGGSIGQYIPVVDLIEGASIPPVATPVQAPNSCGLVPPETPYVCQAGVYPDGYPPPPSAGALQGGTQPN